MDIVRRVLSGSRWASGASGSLYDTMSGWDSCMLEEYVNLGCCGSIVKISEKRPTSLQGPKDLFPMRSLFGGITVVARTWKKAQTSHLDCSRWYLMAISSERGKGPNLRIMDMLGTQLLSFVDSFGGYFAWSVYRRELLCREVCPFLKCSLLKVNVSLYVDLFSI